MTEQLARQLTIGSLCSGYLGLDGAVASFTGGRVIWVADNDPDVARLLAFRLPHVPNLGDLAEIDWEKVERPDILTAGFPCQDVSQAGRRRGLRPGTRTGVWSHIAYAIGILRPQLVLLENVKGLLSATAHSDVEPCETCLGDPAGFTMRALAAVLADLAEIGFDAEWDTVSAADAGSCHGRERVFIAGWPRIEAAA